MHISNIYLEFPNDMNLAELLTLVLTPQAVKTEYSANAMMAI